MSVLVSNRRRRGAIAFSGLLVLFAALLPVRAASGIDSMAASSGPQTANRSRKGIQPPTERIIAPLRRTKFRGFLQGVAASRVAGLLSVLFN